MPADPLQQFEAFLGRQNLRLTSQRRTIAATFFATEGHVSTEELYRTVQKQLPGVGFATVYRTLKLLSEAGLASGHDFNDGFARFEALGGKKHHDHLICTACGKIVEFVNDRIEALQEAVAAEHGFEVHRHRLELYGVCRECRKAEGSGGG